MFRRGAAELRALGGTSLEATLMKHQRAVPIATLVFRRLAGGLVALIGCADATSGPGAGRTLGLITPPSTTDRVLVAPAEVQRGVPFSVTVNTFGSSTCVQPAGMDVQYRTHAVVLTPLDMSVHYEVCSADIAPRPHEARLTFAEAGSNVLTVRGFVIDEQGRRSLGTVSETVAVRKEGRLTTFAAGSLGWSARCRSHLLGAAAETDPLGSRHWTWRASDHAHLSRCHWYGDRCRARLRLAFGTRAQRSLRLPA